MELTGGAQRLRVSIGHEADHLLKPLPRPASDCIGAMQSLVVYLPRCLPLSSRLRPSGQLRVLVFGMTSFSVWIGPSQSRHHPTYRYRSHRESVDGMFTQSVRSKQRYRPVPRRVPKSSLSVVKMVSRTAGYPVTTYLLQRATRTQYVCCHRMAG
jgi:hypothetical protein